MENINASEQSLRYAERVERRIMKTPRGTTLLRMWKERHPDQTLLRSDKYLLLALVAIGNEYDQLYRDNQIEAMLYNRSNQIRKLLGLTVSDSQPTNKKLPLAPSKRQYIRH